MAILAATAIWFIIITITVAAITVELLSMSLVVVVVTATLLAFKGRINSMEEYYDLAAR